MLYLVLSLAAGLTAALAVQAAHVRPRDGGDLEGLEADDAWRLAAALQQSALWSSGLVREAELAGLKLHGPGHGPEHGPGHGPAARSRRGAEFEPEASAEEAAEAAAEADCQPPATGLRRWVIRIRNVMFGRRDLEGTEDGEAEGEPEQGRTWVESLAHWFAHGIKRILIRIGGGSDDELPAGCGGMPQAPQDGVETVNDDPNPKEETTTSVLTPSRRRVATSTTSTTTSTPSTTTARPWTALPPVPLPKKTATPSPTTTTTTTSSTSASVQSKPPGTVYDDEAFEGGRRPGGEVPDHALDASGPRTPTPLPDETNELN